MELWICVKLFTRGAILQSLRLIALIKYYQMMDNISFNSELQHFDEMGFSRELKYHYSML